MGVRCVAHVTSVVLSILVETEVSTIVTVMASSSGLTRPATLMSLGKLVSCKWVSGACVLEGISRPSAYRLVKVDIVTSTHRNSVVEKAMIYQKR